MNYITVRLTEDQAQAVYQIIENQVRFDEQFVKKTSGALNKKARKSAAFTRRLRSLFATTIVEHNQSLARAKS